MRFPHANGIGFYTVFADIMAGLVFLICLAVVVGLLVVIVRFLLVATKAAEIYVARNRPDATAETTTTETTATTPVASTATPVVPATTSTTVPIKTTPARTRTPRPPTA